MCSHLATPGDASAVPPWRRGAAGHLLRLLPPLLLLLLLRTFSGLPDTAEELILWVASVRSRMGRRKGRTGDASAEPGTGHDHWVLSVFGWFKDHLDKETNTRSLATLPAPTTTGGDGEATASEGEEDESADSPTATPAAEPSTLGTKVAESRRRRRSKTSEGTVAVLCAPERQSRTNLEDLKSGIGQSSWNANSQFFRGFAMESNGFRHSLQVMLWTEMRLMMGRYHAYEASGKDPEAADILARHTTAPPAAAPPAARSAALPLPPPSPSAAPAGVGDCAPLPPPPGRHLHPPPPQPHHGAHHSSGHWGWQPAPLHPFAAPPTVYPGTSPYYPATPPPAASTPMYDLGSVFFLEATIPGQQRMTFFPAAPSQQTPRLRSPSHDEDGNNVR